MSKAMQVMVALIEAAEAMGVDLARVRPIESMGGGTMGRRDLGVSPLDNRGDVEATPVRRSRQGPISAPAL